MNRIFSSLCIIFVMVLLTASVEAKGSSIGLSGGFITSRAEDQGTGKAGSIELKIELFRNCYFKPEITSGKFGRVDFPFGSREGANLKSYSFSFAFAKLPGKKHSFGYSFFAGPTSITLTRKYDRDININTLGYGAGAIYALSEKFYLELALRLYWEAWSYGYLTSFSQLGIHYNVDLEELFDAE